MQNTVWTPDALRDHLQKAMYLEVWTIPLYLAGCYSLQVPGTSAASPPQWKPMRSQQNPKFNREQMAFNAIYSVVVQEMLHLEIAANLFNALFAAKGFSPKLTGEWAPRYDRGFPPWIGVKTPVQLGPANKEQLALFSAIETPEPKLDRPPHGPQAVYDSIGQFYNAIQQGVDQLWNALFDPAADPTTVRRQKNEFANPQYPSDNYIGFSAIINATDSDAGKKQADTMIKAIIAEGEGSIGPIVDEQFRPDDPNAIGDDFSHYSRFRAMQAALLLGPFKTYPASGGSGVAAAQADLDAAFNTLLTALETGFGGTAPLDLGAMWDLPGKIVAVWAAGGIPAFGGAAGPKS